jgi:predicted secreted hydrolase
LVKRLWLLLALLAGSLSAQPAAAPVRFPEVTPGTPIQFPRDHGAHPDHRIEWWYLTGWLRTEGGAPLGFQITFFRSRPAIATANPSAFTPRQVLFAHAAVSDPATGKLVHDQRVARAGFGVAQSATQDMALRLLDWSLVRRPDGSFRASTPARGFGLDLAFAPTQPAIANGLGGYSRKGPLPQQASYYYSIPHLKVSGTVLRGGRRVPVTGEAWLDREWSSTLLPPDAIGWDWAGINLDDGGALMAFQVRAKDGRAIYAGGTIGVRTGSSSRSRRTRCASCRGGDGARRRAAGSIRSRPSSWCACPKANALPAPAHVRRAGAGRARHGMPTYWEGAVSTPGGRGYLELTGYAGDLSL